MTEDDGLITITGGKLTTYRFMAEKTGDLAVKTLVRQDPRRKIPPSGTKQIRLGGWMYTEQASGLQASFNKIAARRYLNHRRIIYTLFMVQKLRRSSL